MARFLYALPLLSLAACAVPLPPDPGQNQPVAARDQAMTPAAEEAVPALEAPPAVIAVPGAPAQSKGRRAAAAAPAVITPEPPIPDTLASQPVEEVIVKPDSLTGYWRLTASHTIEVDMGLFSGIHIRYGGEVRDRNICWLRQAGTALSEACVSGNTLKSGAGSVSDDGVTMRWWVGPATIIFSGKFADADRIVGGFSGGVAGLSVTGDVPATLTRFPVPEPLPVERPSAALVRMVWEDVARGKMTEGRYEGAALKRIDQGLPKEMAAQPPQQLLYLGEILIRWRKEQRETVQDVYQVQTVSGRKLCRIASNEQGQVVDFNCLDIDGR